jgi:hypothetical protein
MTPPLPKICRRIRQLFRLIGSPNANEAARAREKLQKELTKHGLSWNDIPEIVATADADDGVVQARSSAAASQRPTAGSSTPRPAFNVLNLVLGFLDMYIGLTPEQRMAVALWTLHTYVFGRFVITPRLALLSPVRGCGKTTLLGQRF